MVYNTYLKSRNGAEMNRMSALKKELAAVERKIDNATELAIETKNKALLSKIEEYEQKREALKKTIMELEKNCSVSEVTEKELRQRFADIRERIRSGETANIRRLIEQFVYRVNVFPDRIEVVFNFYPDKVRYIPKKEEGRADDARPSLFAPEIVVAKSSEGKQ